jgi:hypothetical protein
MNNVQNFNSYVFFLVSTKLHLCGISSQYLVWR